MKLNLYLVVPPYHSYYVEIIDNLELSDAFDRWKLYVLDKIRKYDTGNRMQFWDFSGYSKYNAEPVPVAGDKTTIMKWHAEPGHFTWILGDRVINRIFREGGQGSENFGIRLRPTNIQAHLKAFREKRRKYRESHPQVVKLINRLVRQANPTNLTSLTAK